MPPTCSIYDAYNALQGGLIFLDARATPYPPVLGAQLASTPVEALEYPDAFTGACLFCPQDGAPLPALLAPLYARWPKLKGVLRVLPASEAAAFAAAFPFLLPCPAEPSAGAEGAGAEGAGAAEPFTGPFPSSVGPGVFLGSQWHSSSPQCLAAARFSCLLSLLDTPSGCEPATAAALGLQHHTFPWVDEMAFVILPDLPAVVGAIEAGRAGAGGVLVHCFMGASRSAAAVCAWRLWREGGEVEDVHADLQRARCIVRINQGFLQQLRVWRACVMAAGGPGCPLASIDLPPPLDWNR